MRSTGVTLRYTSSFFHLFDVRPLISIYYTHIILSYASTFTQQIVGIRLNDVFFVPRISTILNKPTTKNDRNMFHITDKIIGSMFEFQFIESLNGFVSDLDLNKYPAIGTALGTDMCCFLHPNVLHPSPQRQTDRQASSIRM